MNLKEQIENYKLKNRNTVEHVFKCGTIFKGQSFLKLHDWLDKCYNDSKIEFRTIGTKNIANWLIDLLRC